MQITVSSLYPFTFLSCSGIKQTEKRQSQINISKFCRNPIQSEFKNTVIGGLSGIDYDAKSSFTISFVMTELFTMMLAFIRPKFICHPKKIDSIAFKSVVSFKMLWRKIQQLGENQLPQLTQKMRFNPKRIL
jgi:hypothetical protein